ncbi:putative C6 transcription factor [Cladophialophora carrionii]|uniref:Putative C6 transcription factor n=1 Tax=Cladophialophora carrionii TaxID=86049 RepID=A0A1C1CQU1_9EURO|nr:putative C6 transcription factor [Cladophialophora carrionii]
MQHLSHPSAASTAEKEKHYEILLREQGIDPASPTHAPSKTETTSTPEDGDQCDTAVSKPREPVNWAPGSAEGKLIVDQGRSRFIENKLWVTVSEELHHSKDAIPDSETEDELETPAEDGADFVLGMTSSPNQTVNLHPSTDHILRLWQLFLTNVNPLVKIIHQPSMQRVIEDATADLGHIPRGLEALMFSIYAAAIHSMRDGECLATFGEARSILQSRYRLGVRRSLTRAHFMGSSDILVLQALVIYLLAVRQELDARTLWTLAGVASRMAQGMGVHRDGAVLGLPPFETEMRRRLWWQINLLDFKAAELSGFGGFNSMRWWNAKTPSNVNDADMWPGMQEPPVEHVRPTEMVICLLHYEMGGFWRKKLTQAGIAEEDLSRAMTHWVTTKTVAEKDVFVDEFQANLEERILRYCDPSVPLEMMALIIGRMMCKSVRFMAHHPRRYASEKDIPETERHFLWTTSMAILEADNLAHSHRSLQRFQWHIDHGFQWHAFIYVLGELAARPVGEGKDESWAQIEDVHKNHPNFISDRRKPLHLAIGNLCLKAWRAREKAQAESPSGGTLARLDPPQFIIQLRKQWEARAMKSTKLSQPGPSQFNLVPQAKDMKLNEVPNQSHSRSQSQSQPQSESQSQSPVQSHTAAPQQQQQQQSLATSHQQQPHLTNAGSAAFPGTSTGSAFPTTTYSPNDFSVMDDLAMDMDWQRWDTLLNDFEMPVPAAGQPSAAEAMNPAQLEFLGQYGQQGYSWPLPAYRAQ